MIFEEVTEVRRTVEEWAEIRKRRNHIYKELMKFLSMVSDDAFELIFNATDCLDKAEKILDKEERKQYSE